MEKFYKWTLGAFSPVPAEDGMTMPVGYKDGQLYTYDRGVNTIIANAFSPTTQYDEGDYVIYEEKMYVCISSTVGPFDETKWDEVQVASLISNLYHNIATVYNTLDGRIDDVNIKADNAFGKGGTFTVRVSDWDPITQSYTKTIPALKVNDGILIGPLTQQDQDNLNGKSVFCTASTGSITLTYKVIPDADLTFQYFIGRGA